jgi:hypothetical protein
LGHALIEVQASESFIVIEECQMTQHLENARLIDVKQAVKIASDYIRDVYDGEMLPGLLLEEVDFSDEEQAWLITLGFDTNRPVQPPEEPSYISRPLPKYERVYKIIKVNGLTGAVQSMKIREI